MMLVVYIGNLDDPGFKWEGGDWNGNAPKRISPEFPTSEGFFELIDRIESNIYIGKQVDWGCWVARVTKEQILKFVDEFHGEQWCERYREFPHLLSKLKDLEGFIGSLAPTKEYALVAMEVA